MAWPELTAAIEEFVRVREGTLEMAAGLSDQQAATRGRKGSWSVAEVLDHLVRTERAFRKYQEQVVERARAGGSGTIRLSFRDVDTRLRPFPRSWMPALSPILFGLHAVIPFRWRLAVMRKPGPLWAAAPRVAEPVPARPLAELRGELRAGVRDTAAVFTGELPETLPRVRAAHPLYGSSDVAQMVRMMSAHEQRHQYQLRGILKAL